MDKSNTVFLEESYFKEKWKDAKETTGNDQMDSSSKYRINTVNSNVISCIVC